MACKKRFSVVFMSAAVAAVVFGAAGSVMAQAPGVEIVRDKGEQFRMLVEKANKLREDGKLLSLEECISQLDRETCDIELPELKTKKLRAREIWARGKAAHVRVGWHYRCMHCDKWHQNLSGGYFINTNGAVATCYHVIGTSREAYREGYLVAANDSGDIFPVTEVLAANKLSDTAIVKVEGPEGITALPLNSNTYPGDSAWCFSDPLGRSAYFSKGIVNRFYWAKRKEGGEAPRMEVSTDWAPGSSGAAVLDECGNAIGHVSEISAAGSQRRKPVRGSDKTPRDVLVRNSPVIVFHCAARAADVLSLVEKEH